MKKILALLLFLLPLSAIGAQQPPLPIAECSARALGFPSTKKKQTSLVCRTGYVLQHDNLAKIPLWVSYTLTAERSTGCYKRSNQFMPDASLPPGSTAITKDYAKSGYDIGHMAPSGDMSWDQQVERDSFILSNMAPQLPGFNRGVWKRLEDYTRGWAISRKTNLLIYTGPVFNRAQNLTIGANRVTVPHAFYKIIIDLSTKETQVYLFPHQKSNLELHTFITSLAEVQHQTGLVFPVPANPIYTGTWPVLYKNAVQFKRKKCH